jgi:hypothetical protein
MRLLGHIELTTVELPNALEFTLVRERGEYELILAPAIVLFVCWWIWRIGTPFNRIIITVILVVSAASAIASWIQGGTTKLRVTSEEFHAEGNLRKLFSTEARIPVSEIESIGHIVADEGEPGGFYVNRKWSRVCVLSGLNRDQGASVTNAIFRKFPYLVPEYIGWGAPDSESQTDLISLGITASDPKDKNPNP